MGVLTSNCCCSEKPTPVRVIVERTRDSVTNILTKCRKVGNGARQAVKRARNRHLENRVTLQCSKSTIERYRSFGYEELATGVLLLMILLLFLLGLHLVRRYNHTFAYGSGGCLSTVFWTYEECLIMT
ncbi:uncharacterized protein LOC108040897 [Drosophila rhopaloa]|uniref:Uncharacterized protein n=1 Tax=Drosophila rhopaloa TaxID=1041015 RepID=A0ABM5JFL2_DRORH|nr:uncharacterized protein LOC108040897 [Drosophila rhopaloa]